jgi:hypothetical protein
MREMVRQMTRDAEMKLASALSTLGVKKKRSRRRSRSDDVEKALVEILVSGQEAPNPDGVLQTIEQIMAQAVRPK